MAGSRCVRASRGSSATASTTASPAAGPSVNATATARLSSTTGDGATRASSAYSAAIWGQSVSAHDAAVACRAAMAAWSW